MFIGNDFPFDAVRYLNRNKYNSMATFTQVKMTTAVSNQPNNITDPNEVRARPASWSAGPATGSFCLGSRMLTFPILLLPRHAIATPSLFPAVP